MGQIIKIDFSTCYNKKENYENKLIRIRDEIEINLKNVSLLEKDELAIALASSRYGIMKLIQLTGEKTTKNCIAELNYKVS